MIWKMPVAWPAAASPAYADGRVFFALGAGKVNEDSAESSGAILCLDAHADSPKRLWEFRTDGSVLGTPALSDDRLYFCSRKGQCCALRQSDGELQWKIQLESGVVAAPVAAGARLYVLTVNGELLCLDAATGNVLWRFENLKPHADEDVYSSPTLANSRLYLAVGGKLFCIGDAEK
jgi:outer membrane protein assembly factor BamB